MVYLYWWLYTWTYTRACTHTYARTHTHTHAHTYTHTQKFNYNLTTHQFNRHTAVVPSVQESFQDSYTRLTSSETAYSGLRPLVETSISNLPSRFSLIEESLDDYSQVVDGIDGAFVLKTKADNLFYSFNQSFVETRRLALGSVQVRAHTHTHTHMHTHAHTHTHTHTHTHSHTHTHTHTHIIVHHWCPNLPPSINTRGPLLISTCGWSAIYWLNLLRTLPPLCPTASNG